MAEGEDAAHPHPLAPGFSAARSADGDGGGGGAGARAGALEAALAALAPRAEVAAVERTPGGYRAWISVPSRLAVLSDAVVRALSGTDTGRWRSTSAGRGFHPAPAWSSVIGVESPGRLARRLGHEPDPAPAGLEFQAVEGGDGADLR
ncbi:MAG: hypothetical protein R3F43_12975 [bacterium]